MIVFGMAMGLMALLIAPAAQGNLTITKWESLTCKENKDIPTTLGVPEVGYQSTLPPPTEQCTDSTNSKFFSQAAGHPNFGITDFRIATAPHPGTEAGGFPLGFNKQIVVDTPEGLSVNPEALPQCPVSQLTLGKCPPTSFVGTNYLTVAAQNPNGEGKCLPAGECLQARVAVPVYNLVPFQGVPSMVGFVTEGGPTFIVGSLDPVDQHVTFTIDVHPPSEKSPPIIESRLVFNGVAGNGTYLTMPSNCAGGQTTLLHLFGLGGIPPFEPVPSNAEASYTTPEGASGCAASPVPSDDRRHSPGRLRRLAGSDDGQRRDPVRSQRTDRQLVSENRESRAARRDEPQPGFRQWAGSLHRRAVRQGHDRTRSPVPPRRKSAPSRCRRHRCRPTR